MMLTELTDEVDFPIIYDLVRSKLAARAPIYLTNRAWTEDHPQRVFNIKVVTRWVDRARVDHIQLWWAPEIDGEVDQDEASYTDYRLERVEQWQLTKSARGLELFV
jgi:hypothetical protein